MARARNRESGLKNMKNESVCPARGADPLSARPGLTPDLLVYG